MKQVLMQLPFAENALEPLISAKTIRYHYGKHHQGYVNKLNQLIEGTPFEKFSLEEIILKSGGAIFNNASQIYNHNFYFKGLCREQTTASDTLKKWIERDFGSIQRFQRNFTDTALNLFGSGWVWLCINQQNYLVIDSRSNADNPLISGYTPLLTCDVWEHAYYIDYYNARADYIEKWWESVNWDFVSQNLDAALSMT